MIYVGVDSVNFKEEKNCELTEEEYNALKQAYEDAYDAWEADCKRLEDEYNAKDALYQQYLKEIK